MDHDVIGMLVVSPDSEVMSGFASPHSPALECTCVLCGPAAICLPIEESVRDESSICITPKEAKDMLQQ